MFPRRILAVLGLAVASVSAIDLRFFNRDGCGSNVFIACNNVNPHFCCWTPNEDYTVSGGFFAIPRTWTIVMDWWLQTSCSGGPRRHTSLNYGRDYYCLSASRSLERGFARGLSYYFNGPGRKREVNDSPPKEGCQRANILHLADGSEYDLSNMSNATYNEVVSGCFIALGS
jgi:hypothetical protein